MKLVQRCEDVPFLECGEIIYSFDNNNQLRGYDSNKNIVRIFPTVKDVGVPTFIYRCKYVIFVGYENGSVIAMRLNVDNSHVLVTRYMSSHNGAVIYITSFEWKDRWYLISYGIDNVVRISVADSQDYYVWWGFFAIHTILDPSKINTDEFKTTLTICHKCKENERQWSKQCRECRLSYNICHDCDKNSPDYFGCPRDYGCSRKK